MKKLEDLIHQFFHPSERRPGSRITSYFQSNASSSSSSSSSSPIHDPKAIIFTQYRHSVKEIVDVLKSYEPDVRPVIFVGQASKGKSKVYLPFPSF